MEPKRKERKRSALTNTKGLGIENHSNKITGKRNRLRVTQISSWKLQSR